MKLVNIKFSWNRIDQEIIKNYALELYEALHLKILNTGNLYLYKI